MANANRGAPTPAWRVGRFRPNRATCRLGSLGGAPAGSGRPPIRRPNRDSANQSIGPCVVYQGRVGPATLGTPVGVVAPAIAPSAAPTPKPIGRPIPPPVTAPPIKAPTPPPPAPATAARFSGSGKFVHPPRLSAKDRTLAPALRFFVMGRPSRRRGIGL